MTTKKKEETVTGCFPVITFDAKGNQILPGKRNTIAKSVAAQIEVIHGKFEKTSGIPGPAETEKTADLNDPIVKEAIADAVSEARANLESDAVKKAIAKAVKKQTADLTGQLEKLTETAGAFVLELTALPVDPGKAATAEAELKTLLGLNE